MRVSDGILRWMDLHLYFLGMCVGEGRVKRLGEDDRRRQIAVGSTELEGGERMEA